MMMFVGYPLPLKANLLENRSFRMVNPLCITSALSADVTTMPNGRPPAADEGG